MINSCGTGKPTEADGERERGSGRKRRQLFGLFGCSGYSGGGGSPPPKGALASGAKPPPQQEPAELNFKMLIVVNNKFVDELAFVVFVFKDLGGSV